MKIVTFHKPERGAAENRLRYGVGALELPDKIIDLTPLVSDRALRADQVLDCFDLESGFLELARAAIGSRDLPVFRRDAVELAAPVPRPGKIICIGLNYRDHAEESGMAIPERPLVFSKFSSCAIGARQLILLPGTSAQVDYEAELAFVVGRRAQGVRRDEAMRYVFGYTNFNDVSARDFQFADGQWTRGKSCDTFAPMGEFVATADEIENPHKLPIRFRLNGETMQDSNTGQLIFGIPELIEYLSASLTLEPGDVVATGTPPGVGFARKPPVFLKAGDVAEVEIEGLGILRNPVG
jgi:acylpyruvate hydrolase